MTKIIGMERLDEIIPGAGHGDNWHTTWAANDKQYTSLCDGEGFDLPGDESNYNNSRIYALTGDPPNHSFEFLDGFPQLDGGSRFYNFGILALGSNIYSFLSHMAETPDREYKLAFIGARLIYSPDYGKTWKKHDGAPCTWENIKEPGQEDQLFFNEPGDSFSLLTVLQMGKDYEYNTDGYVYIYAPNGNSLVSTAQLVLCRVPRAKLLDRSAYEFYVATNPDGSAQWSPDVSKRTPIYTFPDGWVNLHLHPYAWHPSVVYNKSLNVYMMANWGMPPDAEGKWFGKAGYLGFWTAPQPWGPWTQVHEDTHWLVNGDEEERNYQPQIIPKWIAADGKSFWLVHTNFQDPGKRPYYSFNCQKVRIITDED